jgi:N-acetylmuramoyl-L-alanine amidase
VINFKNYLNGIFFTLIFFVLLSLKNLTVFADQKNNLEKNPTSCEIQENKIICFNIKINNNFQVNLLDDPYRILINFKNKFSFNNKNIKTNKLIKNVRFNKKNIDGARLVIELRQPATITDIIYDKLNSEDFINLQILLSKTTVTNFAVAKHILKENDGKFLNFKQSLKLKLIEMPEEETKRLINNTSKEKYIVFIDPGHGGRDPGAIGRLGTLEKNITLKTSIMLRKALKRYDNINSILSRNKDIYLSLKERTKLAKINNADIFISLHADSSKNKKANGISVFSLSDKASDKEAKMLAKRENDVDNFLGNKNKIKDPIIYNTLIKMFQRKAMNDSSYLAKKILSNLEKTKLAVNRGHRFAGFAVLKSYEIPSVLIEIGFLSNKQEEKKMLNTKYLNELSNGLAIAIGSYFDSYKE